MNSKKAQMEMSIGTIVTIVILMTVLVMGLVLVRTIFSGATNAIDLTNAQLTDQINQLFSQDKKMVIYPGTNEIEMQRGEQSAIGIGIKNRLEGAGQNPTFNYDVSVEDPEVVENCGVDSNTIQSWIQGASGNNIDFPTGDDVQVEKVLFNIPSTAPLCSVKIRVKISTPNIPNYDSDSFFMTIK
ncbi:MAG: hypothetical protein ABIH49_01920 [archaeon]